MNNTYKKIIELLTEDPCKVDCRAITIGLLRKYPDIFLELHNGYVPVSEATEYIYQCIVAKDYVEAVVRLHTETGCAFTDAKDVIMRIRDAFREERTIVMVDMSTVLAPFHGDALKFVEELIRFANKKRGL